MLIEHWHPFAAGTIFLGVILLLMTEWINVTIAVFLGAILLVFTKVFDYLATQMVILARGQGKRLLLGIVALTTPICAVLPNATTVLLLAPLLPPMAAEVGVAFVPLIILMVIVSNSAGCLTLVGDPVTYLGMRSISVLPTISCG